MKRGAQNGREIDLTHVHPDLSFVRAVDSEARGGAVWICRFQVTHDLAAFAVDRAGASISFRASAARLPISMIRWQDAVRLSESISRWLVETGEVSGDLVVRLPTEIEWELAARGGTSTKWYFGEDVDELGEHAWYDGNSGGRENPVGSKLPNPIGLFDAYGNVAEWCLDAWYPQVRATVFSGGVKVVRGGACDYPAHLCTSAGRAPCHGDNPMSEMTGIRLAIGHPIVTEG